MDPDAGSAICLLLGFFLGAVIEHIRLGRHHR
jgi:hypothetical protein